MRTRRRKLTATQLMSQNQSEEIIDKNNRARDAMKIRRHVTARTNGGDAGTQTRRKISRLSCGQRG